MSDTLDVCPGHVELQLTVAHCYQRLLQVAARLLAKEYDRYIFEPEELVHEAFLRLIHMRRGWYNEEHFVNLAAQMMRYILCDQARRRHRQKRKGQYEDLSIDEVVGPAMVTHASELAVAGELDQLIKSESRCARVAKLKIEGFSVEEIASTLKVSQRTVKRECSLVRSAFMASSHVAVEHLVPNRASASQ